MEFVWIAVAVAATLAIARGSRDALAAPALRRTNYAGRDVATGGGMLAVSGFLVAMGLRAAFDFDGSNWQISCMVVVTGFAAVGLFDDLVGTHLARGLRGHLRAARRGELTSGAVKLVAGVAIAFVASVPFADDTEGRLLCAVVIAGAANVANLFDLAPGRLTKVAVVVAAALALNVGELDPIVGPLMFLAASLALLLPEMRETLMLGDAGANPLGAALGLMVVAAADGDHQALWVSAIVVIAINVAGELVSFSRVIERVPPLRALDQLGRRK
jgi:UDP-N-acetylmuramyl pentapeptide phosphotransferase/UDP-N-acetylglucosamine-1-phosphate transferase